MCRYFCKEGFYMYTSKGIRLRELGKYTAVRNHQLNGNLLNWQSVKEQIHVLLHQSHTQHGGPCSYDLLHLNSMHFLKVHIVVKFDVWRATVNFRSSIHQHTQMARNTFTPFLIVHAALHVDLKNMERLSETWVYVLSFPSHWKMAQTIANHPVVTWFKVTYTF